MITQLGYVLTCDSGDQCRADTLDGGPARITVDTITSEDALRIARREGWRRLSWRGHHFDACPACLVMDGETAGLADQLIQILDRS